jgi:hypothetical protein
MYRIRSMKVVPVFLPVLLILFANSAKGRGKPSTADALQAVVSELEALMQMSQRVRVSIVPSEAKMVSVQRVRDTSAGAEVFEIRLDQAFFDSLNPEEVRAALAHELGHVWISSHHPYLQTEALANEIAMRAVTRESLEKIYAKLWLHLGTTGNVEELLGSEKTTPEKTDVVSTAAAKRD